MVFFTYQPIHVCVSQLMSVWPFAEQQLIFQIWARPYVILKSPANQIGQTDAVALFAVAELELKKKRIVRLLC